MLSLRSVAHVLMLCLSLSWMVPPASAAPLPKQIVIQLDPEVDLQSTRRGWAVQPPMALGCPAPGKANQPPLKSPPFTRAEVVDLAKKAKRLLEKKQQGRTFQFISLKARGAAGIKLLPVDEYVKQLNAVEAFLNLYGRSLREKATDLGVVARLRPKDPPCTPATPKLTPIPDPRVFDPSDPARARVNPGDIFVFEQLGGRGPLFRPVFDDRVPTERSQVRLREDLTRWQHSSGPAWFSPSAHVGRQAYNYEPRGGGGSTQAHATTLSARFLEGDRGALRNQRIVAGHVQMKVGQSGTVVVLKGNPDCPGSSGGLAPCPENDPSCDDMAQCGVCVSTSSHKCPPPDPSGCQPVDPSGPVGGAKGGNFDIIPGHKGKNLCDITMGLTMPVWNGCIANNDGFAGWFGGQSCISIVSTNSGHAGVFSFDDSVSLNSGMKFFGVDINLLTASAEAKFESAGGPSTVGPTVSGPVALAGVDECCPPIEGPSTIIPIMGYPLVITSQLNVHVNGKDLKPVANPMPSDCNAGPIKVVAVTGKGSAQVSAQLVAALSIEIIEVGIKGVLDLVNDEIHGSIDTVANQGANALTVTPAMGYSSTRGSGEVTLFFTIDFFFSKTWTISLASWTGFQVKDEFPHDPGNGFAVTDPEVVCKTGK